MMIYGSPINSLFAVPETSLVFSDPSVFYRMLTERQQFLETNDQTTVAVGIAERFYVFATRQR